MVEGDEEIVKTKNMTGGGVDDGKPVRALIEDLMPGVKYRFEIHTVSYGLESDITPLTTRTSESSFTQSKI